jgi:cytochrome c551
MYNKSWLNTTFCIFLVVGSLVGCGGNNNTTPASPPAPAASSPAMEAVNAEAENLYRKNCIVCHAADLSGQSGPNLQKIGGAMTAEEIHAKIANGGGGMPGFKNSLTEDQITTLTNWLVTKT